MRIMTFNLRTDFLLDINNRWDSRRHLVYDIINTQNCDIIGVQEVTSNMYHDLENNCSFYKFVGDFRTKKFLKEKNDILVNINNEILEYDTFWLSKKPSQKGSSIWYSLYPRICTTALIKIKDGKLVRVYNTHLDCLFNEARMYGIKQIKEYMKKKDKKENVPIILMGDFNATPKNQVILKLKEEKINNKNLISVQEKDKSLYNQSTMSKFKGNKNGRHIDYIFVSDQFKVNEAKIIDYNKRGKYPSDHYPILADIELY